MLLAALGQSSVYAAFIIAANRSDWTNLAFVCAALAIVSITVGSLVIALRRNQFPLSTALVISVITFNFAVAVLSALRILLSYTGLATSAPILIAVMVHANIKFHRGRRDRVRLLDFRGADVVKAQLSKDIRIVTLDDLEVANFDRILIDSDSHHSAEWSRFLNRLYMLGIEVSPWMHMESSVGRVDIDSFDLTHLAYSPSQVYYSQAKRVIDVTAVLVLAPIAIPIGLLAWLYIRAIDGGPSIFVQDRRGHGGSTFRMYKFRTMQVNSEAGATQSGDHRILPGCRFLRLFRIDEVPQLVNILRGEMSWIGPRPVSMSIAEALEDSIPQYINRQLVLPGLTGWAQVSHGYASNHDEEIQKLSYDLYYIKHMSFDLDAVILFKTVNTLLFRTGAK
ncbi:sugar transferase [uncultured Devosia sp.]|uniref:sugar transferase n=1 Tax=uncultured Devosia sp. TaxID=211434 RepID=UPI0035C94380